MCIFMSDRKENLLRAIFPRIGIRCRLAIELLTIVRARGRVKKKGEWVELREQLAKKYQTSCSNVATTTLILKKRGLLEYKKGYYNLGKADCFGQLENDWKEFSLTGEVV